MVGAYFAVEFASHLKRKLKKIEEKIQAEAKIREHTFIGIEKYKSQSRSQS